MTDEQLANLIEGVQAMKTAKGKPFHFRLIGGGSDGKPILMIQKTDAGLDAAARDARGTAKDKRLAAGRVTLDDEGLLFGVDEGNFKADSAKKCLNKELGKEKGLGNHKTLMAGARLVDGEAWNRVKPGAEPTGDDVVAVGTDDLGIHTRREAQETGKKSSEKSDKKGSDYSLFLEALDTWHNRFGAGNSVAIADTDKALAALDGIEQKANDWLAKHKKSLIETRKTKDRRTEVEEVAHQVQDARTKLAALVEFARVKDTWDKEIGPVVAHDRIARAEEIARELDVKARQLGQVIGDSPRAQSATRAHTDAVQAIDTAIQERQQEATRRERLAKDAAQQALQQAINGVATVFPDGFVELSDVDREAEAIGPIQRALDEVNRLFPTRFGKPKELIASAEQAMATVRREVQIARDLAVQAGKLDGVVQELEQIANTPIVPNQVRDLNQRVRAVVPQIEAFETGLGERRPPDLLERARRAFRAFAMGSSDAWGKPLADVQKAVEQLAKWRHGIDPDDLSQARGQTDRLEVLILKAREEGVDHVDLDNAGKVLDHLRSAIRDSSMQVRVTKEELERFREGARQEDERARLEEVDESNTWKGKVQQGLDNGRYTLGTELSSGTFGEVLLYLSTKEGDPPLVVKRDKQTANEVDKEWEIYQQLGAHPNIARVLGKVDLDGQPSLVMDKIEGGNGKEAMAKAHKALGEGTLTSLEFWGGLQHLVRGTIRGLAHMETKGLGHNDIKHLNVMINAKTGEPLLVDMGSARKLGEKEGPGTYQFVPMDASKTSTARDIFSVGGIAIAGAMGGDGNPMYGNDDGARDPYAFFRAWQRLAEGAPPLSTGDKAAKFSSVFKHFVRATYALDPEERPSYAEALEHPFLADPLLPEKEAKDAMKKIANL